MKLDMSTSLNPICEILGLIYDSLNYDKLKEKLIESLNEKGINGLQYYKSHFKIFDKYIKEFTKNISFQEKDHLCFFEDEEDMTLYFIIHSLVLSNAANFDRINSMSDDEVRDLILDAYYDIKDNHNRQERINSINNMVTFIENQELSDIIKWKFIKLLTNPRKIILGVIEMIKSNISAYEEAYKVVEKPLKKLIEKTMNYVESGQCEILNSISHNSEVMQIAPTLSFGVSIFELNDKFFIGVLTEGIYRETLKTIGNKGDIILNLKALSDKSKLETLSLLKEGPKYSLEIAESLKLTSATVSYHMATLLEIGLVSAEKKQGKVYYYLNKVAIEKFIKDLNNELL